MIEVRLQHQFLSSNVTSFDKRLQLEDLSEDHCILRRAGYPGSVVLTDTDGTIETFGPSKSKFNDGNIPLVW